MVTATAETKKPPRTRKGDTEQEAPAKVKREMDDDHKEKIAAGRKEARAVRRYLEAIEATRPRRGRKRTVENMKARLEAVEEELTDGPDALNQLLLNQEKKDLTAEIAQAESEAPVDLSEFEAEFVQVAKSFGARKRIDKSTWKAQGVPPEVLKKAGI